MNIEYVEVRDGSQELSGYLYSAGSKTLVFQIHGQNGSCRSPHYIRMAEVLGKQGIDCFLFSVKRKRLSNDEVEVTTVSEETRQAELFVRKLKPRYDKIVVAGASQAGMTCLELGAKSLVDGIVLIFSVIDPGFHVYQKLKRLGITQEELRKSGGCPYLHYSNDKMIYRAEFFDDFSAQKPLENIKKWTRPILFMQGTRDSTIPEKETMQGFDSANEPKKLVHIDSEHKFNEAGAEKIAAETITWLKENKLVNE